MKHFIGAFVGVVFLVVGLVRGLKIFTPKLINLKTAFIDVKMNIPFIKIGRASLPNHCFGMERLDRQPRTVADTFAVFVGQGEKNFQFVAVGFLVNFEY